MAIWRKAEGKAKEEDWLSPDSLGPVSGPEGELCPQSTREGRAPPVQEKA